jgi:predicted GNAT superfamily acetyltransferase
MKWELWDEDSANLLGDCDDRTEAIRVAAELIAANRDPGGFVLLALDQQGQVVGSIAGVELATEATRIRRAAFA